MWTIVSCPPSAVTGDLKRLPNTGNALQEWSRANSYNKEENMITKCICFKRVASGRIRNRFYSCNFNIQCNHDSDFNQLAKSTNLFLTKKWVRRKVSSPTSTRPWGRQARPPIRVRRATMSLWDGVVVSWIQHHHYMNTEAPWFSWVFWSKKNQTTYRHDENRRLAQWKF